jgi:arylsulfatase A-like enzyme
MRRHGITDFRTPLSQAAFAQTYPAILRDAGYRTGYLGKYAIGNPQIHPERLTLPEFEFDYWYGFPQSISFKQIVDGQTRFLTEVMTEKAIEFLEIEDDRPFCLTIALKEPHGPFTYFDPHAKNPYEDVEIPASPTFTVADFEQQPEFIRHSLNGSESRRLLRNPESYQAELRTFYRTVSRADQVVGDILAALERLGLAENTVIIYSSDHGSLLGDHGLTGKWLMYENSIRVPLIIDDPRLRLAGEKTRSSVTTPGQSDAIVLSIDLAPTMLSIAGVPIPETMDGRDLMPLVRDESVSWRSHFYYEHCYTPEDKHRAPIPRTEGIRTARWKYVRFPDQVPVYEQLFDLDSDPLERRNLIREAEYRGQTVRLRALCDDRPL